MRNEELEKLLSAYLDGELTQADQQRVRIYLEDSEGARERYEELCKLREITSSMAFAPPPDERLDELERVLSVSAPRRMGWIFLSGGGLALAALGAYRFLAADDWSVEKILAGSVSLGLLFLLGSVARQRWLEWPHDRYRGVKR